MDKKEKEQYVKEIIHKKFEDLTDKTEIAVYKEYYPEYKTKSEKFWEAFLIIGATFFVLPFLYIAKCFKSHE